MLTICDVTGGSSCETAQNLSLDDARHCARLHAIQLPSSLIAAFGRAGLIRYYKWAARSPLEHVLVACRGGAVAGCALVSYAPHSIAERAVKGGLWRHAMHLPFSAAFWRKLAMSSTGEDDPRLAPLFDPDMPELLQIFVSPDVTGGGIGSRMVEELKSHARERGHGRLLVRTEDVEGNRALRFYPRQGFEPLGSHISNGKPLAVFMANLVAGPPSG